MMSFWDILKKPILCLAPMYDVTDAAFRRIIARYGKPDITFTEFVSVEGLQSIAQKKLLREFEYSESERPVVAQVFGIRPENFEKSAELIRELGFDGIDINMGCPDRAVMKQGSGAALIDEPTRAKEIIAATRVGAKMGLPEGIPVSVKTRLGTSRITIEKWIPELLSANPAAITIHGRTAMEMSKVHAHWDEIGKAAAIARESGVYILGNGDVRDVADARAKVLQYGVDGVMFGRAVFGNPWLFSEIVPNTEARLTILMEHIQLFEELFGAESVGVRARGWSPKNFSVMKKHFKAYIGGFPGAHDLRVGLMGVNDAESAVAVLKAEICQQKSPDA